MGFRVRLRHEPWYNLLSYQHNFEYALAGSKGMGKNDKPIDKNTSVTYTGE